MYYEVYIDIVFVTNLLMDYILLRIVGMLFKCRGSQKRCLLAAAFGALFSCLILYVPTDFFLPAGILLHGGCAYYMLRAGLGLKKRGLMGKGLLVLYLTAFLCGGVWEAYKMSRALTLRTFFMAAAGTYLGLTAFVYLSEAFRVQRKNIYPVTLSYQGKVQSSYGLYDTGNLLRDSIDGGPVSIVKPVVLEALLSGELVDKLKHLKENPGELKSTELAGLHPHFLPYRTVGQEGILLAVTLEDLVILTPREAVHIERPVFALSFEPSALGDEYEILLNSTLLSH